MRTSRPYVIINAAMSLDGKISTKLRSQLRISSPQDLERVQRLRSWADGIMVGIGTLICDDPKLTIKSPQLIQERISQGRSPQPARIIVDSRARIPLDSQVLSQPGEVILATTQKAPLQKLIQISSRARILIYGKSKVDLEKLLIHLRRLGIRNLLVEGGGTLNWGLISAGLCDELQVYIAPMIIGGSTSPSLVDGEGFLPDQIKKLSLVEFYTLGEGIFARWRFDHR